MKRALRLFAITITSILLFAGKSAYAVGNLSFVNGTPQALTVCQNSTATAINAFLITSDDQAGETLTWSVFLAPSHGTLSGFNATATSVVGNSTPSGLTYTPTAGYSGGDVIQIQVSNGTNSAFTQINITVQAAPSPSFTTSPSANICTSASVTYTTQSGGGLNSYAWSVPGVAGTDYTITSGGIGAANSTVTLTWLTTGAKTVTVNYKNLSGCLGVSPASSTTTVNARPSVSFTSAPGATICGGVNTTYTTQAGQSSYTWSVPGTSGVDYNIVAGGTGSGSNTVTLNWITSGNKTVTVNYTNAGGCTSISPASNTTNVLSRPTATFTSAATANTCSGSSVTYTTQSGQFSYIWSVPGTGGVDYNITSGGIGSGSNTVTLTWITVASRTVTVNYSDINGCTSASNASSTTSVNARPVPTFTSSAGAATCAGTSVTYTTQAGQSSYIWSLPGTAGTDYTITSGGTGSSSSTVTLFWKTGGSKTVTVNYTDANGCTGVAAASNTTTVNAPAPTFTSSAGASVCAGTTVTYTTQTGGGITNYVWSVPGTAGVDYNITAGGTGSGSNTVTLNWVTAGSQTVTVNYTDINGCTGMNPASSTTTVNARPVPSFTTAPAANSCVGVNITYTTQSGQSSYIWSVPGVAGTNYTIVSGGIGSGSNTVTLNWLTTGSQTVTINYTNVNGCTGAAAGTNTTIVNPLPTPSFSAAPGASTCAGVPVTYTTQSGGGISSYAWSVPGIAGLDYNITGGGTGSGSNTVTINWLTGGSKTVTVNYNNSFGCSGASAASNTTAVHAPAPTFTSVPATPACAGVNSVYTTQAGQVSYAWSVPGALGTDYTIAAGGIGAGSNTVTINWITTGSKTVTVNYTDVFGCTGITAASNTSVVNPSPSAITGPTSVCTGSTITLTNSTGGGTWSSSTPAMATIGSASGIVTGYAVGTPSMSYTIAGGCAASYAITVNQTPTGISGTLSSCVGGSNTLTNGYSGGTWSSSNPAVASVVAGTGVVSALTPGTATITYTLPGGCTATVIYTVNPNPAAIGGTTNVCVGLATTLTNATSGGTWTSSATGVATIWSGTGLVNGITAGTTNISYTLGTGCYATTPLTVNPLPAAITGATAVCVGSTTTLSNVTGTGTWSSSTPAQASIVSGTGVATGVAAGTPTISYTLATGCYSTYILTVNPLPAAIAGTTTVCVGLTTNLTDATGGGTWTSSNTGLATVTATTGVVTGVAGGSPTISYTLPTGCFQTSALVVNPLPTAIGGSLSICPGTTSTLTNGTGGGTWTSNNTAVATINSASGLATGVSAGISTITYTLPTGCIMTAVLTVNPNPAALTGTASVCQGLTTTLASASGGGTWSSATPANATVVAGTGVVTGVAGGTTANIVYTLPTGCLTSQVVTVNALPAAIVGANNVCVGLTTTLTDVTGASTWSSSNTAMATVGAATGVVTGVAAGAITITFTIPATGCIATLPFTVNPTPASITGGNNVCVGSNIALANVNGGGTWSSSNPAFGTVNAVTGVTTGIAAGSMNIVYTLPAGCTATLPFTVNSTPAAIGGASSVCTGLTTTLTDATGGGTWSSSNTSLATVVSGTGVVSGVASGALTITYTTNPGSCFAVLPFTVNQTPAANTGTASVCTGLTTTLANSTSGGTWSSASPGNATVVAGTGVVTGVAAPSTAVISYTLGTGCFANTIVTVNQNPAAIAGATSVCTGATTTLTNTVGGGTWSSSNTALATVVAGTGVVTGVAAGTLNITYTLGSCFVTYALTVNQTPPAIVGTNQICTGLTTALSDGIGGGTWTSSNTAMATVGSATGLVLGVTPGSLNIVYTLPGGCFATFPVTVNTQPASIAGTPAICTGTTTTLTDATPTGVWSSSNTSVATIVAGTGLVNGVAAGTTTITYTMTGNCISVFPMTVNQTPAAIGGTAVVCVGSNTTLTDGIAGGIWTSSNTAQATVGSATGIVAGIAAGNPSIVYTLPGGCTASVTLTVNALPALFSVTGGGSYCAGGAGLHIGLSNSEIGVNYQLFNGVASVGAPLAGTGLALDFGFITTAGNYTVVATRPATGCTLTMTGSANIVINPLPFAYTVTGGGSYCAGGTSTIRIGLASSAAFGVTYQLFNGSPLGSSIPGTGVVLDFGIQSLPGTYTVIGTSAAGCTNTMAGTAVITVNPAPSLHNVTGGGSYCAGGLGVHVGLDVSDIGFSYQLYLGGTANGAPLSGTGASLDFGFKTAAGTYTVLATNTTTGCSILMTGSAVISINALPTAFAVTAPAGNSYCIGGAGVAIVLTGSSSGVNYQLNLAGSSVGGPVGGTGIALPMGTVFAAGNYTVVATDGTTGCVATMSSSVTVSVNPLPVAYAVTGTGSYCAGGAGVRIGLSSSQIGVAYQLSNLLGTVGSPVTGTGLAIDFGLQTTASTYTVVATSIATGCVNNMTGSAVITINPLPTAYTMSASGAYCIGGTGIDVAMVGGSQLGIIYQLYRGATAVGAPIIGDGTTSPDFGLQTVAGTYTVQAKDPATLCTVFMTGSTVVTVNPLPAPFTMTGGGSFCAGGTGVAVGLSGSAVGVNYQLYNGASTVGGLVAGTGFALNFGLQTTGGTYTVQATSAAGCVSNMSGSSLITINPLPSVYAITGGTPYCTGCAGTHIGLAGSDIGVNYQLYFGITPSGSPLAGTGAPLDFGVLAPIGTYSVSATNPVTGCINGMGGTVTLSTTPLPAAFTVSGTGSYCAGGAGVPVMLSNTEAGVNYQLYRGTIAVGAPLPGSASGPFSMGAQTVAGTYTVVAVNVITGCTSNMPGSAVISVNPLPAAFTVTGGGGYCTGGSGVVVGLSGSVSGVSYQLYRGGVTPVGVAALGTGTPISFGLQTVAGAYTVVASAPVTTCTVNMVSSATVSINLPPSTFNVTGGGHYCSGGTGSDVQLSGSEIGVNYQLLLGAVPVGSPLVGTSFALDFGLQAAAGTYTVQATNAVTGCNAAMIGSAAVVIDPLPVPYVVTGGGNFCPGGAGVNVGLLFSAIGTNYQLYNGSTPVAFSPGIGAPLTFGLQTAPGVYTVKASMSTSCSSVMPGSATVGFYTLPTVYPLAGGGSYCAGDTGLPYELTGSDIGTNYQLFNDDTAISPVYSGTGGPISFGLQTAGGSYMVIATSSITTCTDSSFAPAAITVNPLPMAHLVTGGGSYCPGGAGVHITLDGSDAGINYQLYKGSLAVGSPFPGTTFPIDFGAYTATGIYSIVATDVTTLCSANMTGNDTITTYALPAIYTVTGGGSYCAGGTGVSVGLNSSHTGVVYQLYVGTTPVGVPDTGTGAALNFGVFTTPGIYTVVATTIASGCTNNMGGSATIAINPLPAIFNVTGGGGYCTGGAGVHIGLSGSVAGISYQLLKDSTVSGAPVAGTGIALDFGLRSTPGVYKVVARNTTTGCLDTMVGAATVNINALPVAYTVSAGAPGYCVGGSGVVVYISGSDLGVNYQLYRGTTPVGAPIAGTGTTGLDFGAQTIAGSYTVVATNATTGCTRTMTGAASFVVYPLPPANVVSGGGSFCVGGAGVNVGMAGTNLGLKYQLYKDGVAVGSPVTGTGAAIDFGTYAATGMYTVIATNPVTGCSSNMIGSAIVATNPLPVVYTVTGGGAYCAGTTGVGIGLSGSVTGTEYRLYSGATPVSGVVPGTGLPVSMGTVLAAGTYTVKAVNVATGCASDMAGSATVVVNAAPAAYALTGGGSFCPGGTGVSVGLYGSANGIKYDLYVGGVATGAHKYGTGLPLDFGLQTTIGSYTIKATDTATGCTSNMTGAVAVAYNSLPVAYNVVGGGAYCAGGAGVNVGIDGSNSGIAYQLYRDGAAVTSGLAYGTGGTLSFGLQTAVGTYTVRATNATTGCVNDMAGSVSVSVNPVITPSVTISTVAGDTACNGIVTTFTAVPVNGGTSPSYNWIVNGVLVGSADAYSYAPANGDVVRVVLTSSAACTVPDTAGSMMTMTVLPQLMPVAEIAAAPGNEVCRGTTVTYTATATNGGTAPDYTWKKNGTVVSTGSAAYNYIPSNGDVITCVLNSNYYCRLANSVISNAITMQVDTPVTPSVTITASPSNYIVPGQMLTFSASVDNAVIAPTYQWYVNNHFVPGANLPTYADNAFTNLEVVECIVTSGGGCAGATGTSNSITIHVSTVGVGQVTANFDVQLVPNPNKGIFTLKGDLGTVADKELTVEITNMLGQTVYTGRVTAKSGTINQTIQLGSNLTNGMYILNLRSEDGNKVFHMVVEQ